jgi:hypothetical protein
MHLPNTRLHKIYEYTDSIFFSFLKQMEKKSIVQKAKTTNPGQGRQESKHPTSHWTSQGQSRGLHGVGVVVWFLS